MVTGAWAGREGWVGTVLDCLLGWVVLTPRGKDDDEVKALMVKLALQLPSQVRPQPARSLMSSESLPWDMSC